MSNNDAMLFNFHLTPMVYQSRPEEDGAACLSILLSYYGVHIPPELIYPEIKGLGGDCSAANIKRFAESIGLTCKEFHKEIQELKTMLMPCIIYWDNCRFVVLEGFFKEEVFINDPSIGSRVLSWEQFDAGFSGIVLVLEKNEEINPEMQGNYCETPVILMRKRIEEGAIPLSVILTYYGLDVPMKEICREIGITEEPPHEYTALQIKRAAEHFGLKCTAFRKKPETLKTMKMPCLIYWNNSGFLVLEGFYKENVIINDPIAGRRKLSWHVFCEGFTGIVFTFEKPMDLQD